MKNKHFSLLFFLSFFTIAQFIVNVNIARAQNCVTSGTCYKSGTSTTCSKSGEDCSGPADCASDETCKPSPWCNTADKKDPVCTLSGNSCSGGCPAGYCAYGGCGYVPPPTPRPPDPPEDQPDIVDTPACTCSSGWVCCPGTTSNCVPAGNEQNCVPGNSTCQPFWHDKWTSISVRFALQQGDGSLKYIKPPHERAPIQFSVKSTSSSFSVIDINNYGAETGFTLMDNQDPIKRWVPLVFQSHKNNDFPKWFDWNRNTIVDDFFVDLITPESGQWIPNVRSSSSCYGVATVQMPGSVQTGLQWAMHYCARGRSNAPDSRDPTTLSGDCQIKESDCNEDPENCRRYCLNDVDGCFGSYWGGVGYPNAGETRLGFHSELKRIIENFRRSGLKDDYDNTFTGMAVISNGKGRYAMDSFLIYNPPSGYSCGYIEPKRKEDSSGNLKIPNIPILTDEEKIERGFNTDNCVIRLTGDQIGGYFPMTVIMTKGYFNQCGVSVDGSSQVTINTNSVTGSDNPLAMVDMYAISNEDRLAEANQNGAAQLIFIEKNGLYVTPPAAFTGQALNQFTKLPNVNAWQYNAFIQSTDGVMSTLPSNLVPKFSFKQSNWNLINSSNPPRHFPEGTYHAFCRMPFGELKCTGNPRCTVNGGTVDCGNVSSCAPPSGKFIEEIAIKNNRVKYRHLPISDSGNNIGQITTYPEWKDGPFSISQMSDILKHFGKDGIVKTLAVYTAPNTRDNKKNTFVMMWVEYPEGISDVASNGKFAMKIFIINNKNGYPEWQELHTLGSYSTYFLYTNAYNFPPHWQVTAHSMMYNPLTNKLRESIWLRELPATPDETREYWQNPELKIKGYWRDLNLNTDGSPEFYTANGTAAWNGPIFGNNSALSGDPSKPITNHGIAIAPLSNGWRTIRQGWGRLTNSNAPAQYLRHAINYQNPDMGAFPNNDPNSYSYLTYGPWQNPGGGVLNENTGFEDRIFGNGAQLDAYEMHYIESNLKDSVRMDVQCIANCDVCSNGTEPNGCGGTCAVGALTGLSNPNNLSFNSQISSSNELELNWTKSPKAEGYQLVAYPVTSSESQSTDINIIKTEISSKVNNNQAYIIDINNNEITQYLLPLDDPKFKGISPKLRIAIRAYNACSPLNGGALDWQIFSGAGTPGGSQFVVPLTASLKFTIQELTENTPESNYCSPANANIKDALILDNQLKVKGGNHTPFSLVNTNPFVRYPQNNQPEVIFNPNTPINKIAEHTLSSFWHAPNVWFNNSTSPSPFYSLSISQTDLNNNDLMLACPSNLTGLNAPALTSPIPIYLRRAYKPWFQVRGGNLLAVASTGNSNITSNIPLSCASNANCNVNLITKAVGSSNNYSAGLALASGAITINRPGQVHARYSENSNARGAGVFSSPEAKTKLFAENNIAKIQQKIDKALEQNNVSAKSIGTAGISSFTELIDIVGEDITNKILIDAEEYIIAKKTRGSLTLNAPTGGFVVNKNYILIVEGNITVESSNNPAEVTPPTPDPTPIITPTPEPTPAGGGSPIDNPGTGGNPPTSQLWQRFITKIFASSPLPNMQTAIQTPASTGSLLIIATGNITFSGNIGTEPASLNYAPQDRVSAAGIFIAGNKIIINGRGDDSQADLQFVGKGSFIGLGGVDLNRSFNGSDTGLPADPDLRSLHNTYPTEIFIHDANMVNKLPLFIKEAQIKYQER